MAVKILAVNEYYVIFFTTLFSLPAVFLIHFHRPAVIRFSFYSLRRNYLILALLALSLLLNNYFYFAAFNRTSIAIAVFTHYTAPLFVAILAPLLLFESFEKQLLLPLFIALLGLALVLFPNLRLIDPEGGHLAGAFFGLASGLAYAFTLIFAKKLTSNLKTLDLIFWQGVFIVFFLLPFYFSVPAGPAAPQELSAWLILLILGLTHCLLAPFLYLRGLHLIPAQHAAIIGYLEPLAAVALGLFINHESPSPAIWFGGTAILISGALTIFWRRQKVNLKL